MKGFIVSSITALIILISAAGAGAGQFLSISSVDSQTEFPRIKVFLTVKGLPGGEEVTDEHVTVYEDGFRANWLKVKNISSEDDLLYLVFSIDSSKSISREFLKSIKSNAREIVSSAGPKDRLAIYRFDDSVKLLTGFTEKKRDLLSSIESIERHGKKTMLFNSIFDSLELLESVKSERKKIIVFTDGKDEGSSIREKDIVDQARKAGIPLYFISIESSDYIPRMARIAKLTGGKLVYSSNHEDVAGMYRAVLSVIKSTYELNYNSLNQRDGKEHRVEVRLKHGDVRDRDTKNVVFYSQGFDLSLPIQKDIILIILVALLLALLAGMLIFFLKREKECLQEKYESEYKIDDLRSRFEQVFEQDQKERVRETPVLLEDDSEYTYSSAWLVQKEGPESGKKFPIYWDELTLGRGRENSIVIEDEAVSLNHAKIKNVRKGFHLFDLVSDNGTYLNGKKLLRPRPLYDWDEIRVGRTLFIFRGSRFGHKN